MIRAHIAPGTGRAITANVRQEAAVRRVKESRSRLAPGPSAALAVEDV